MCSNERQDGPRGYLANLRQPMPWWRKLYVVVRNMWLRVLRMDTCCGHPGEPGC
jgi:hypothetical protein